MSFQGRYFVSLRTMSMNASGLGFILISLLLSGCNVLINRQDHISIRDQVFAVERAFAKSMADRNLDDFASFISVEAIFFSGSGPLRGKTEVVAWWKQYFTGATAPFSWEPEAVEVLKSGTLALSSGPVRDADGKIIARYTSIWRLEAAGTWRIIFDHGSPVAAAAE